MQLRHTPTIHVDAVVAPAERTIVAVAVLCAEDHAVWDEGEPPDMRHANPEALAALFHELPVNSVSAIWVAESRDDGRSLNEVVLDLVAWAAWSTCRSGRSADLVSCERALSLIGEQQRRLPGPDELDSVLARVRRDAASLALTPAAQPSIGVIPFGVPSTPRGLARARLTAISVARGLSVPAEPPIERVPPPRVLRELESLALLAEQRPQSPMAIARSCRVLVTLGGPSFDEVVRGVFGRLVAGALEPAGREASAAMLRACIGEMIGIADARQGDYEACEIVLDGLVDPKHADARSAAEVALAGDPWVLANAWLVRARIANHRGESPTATRACKRALAAARRETSLRARVVALEVSNLAVVAAQNRWPYGTGSPALQELQDAAAALEEEVQRYRRLVLVLGEEAPLPTSGPPRLAVGAVKEPVEPVRDPVLGAAYGTLGRSFAFLGRHDDAIAALLFARAHFVSPLDRSVNTCFLLHVELDRSNPDPSVVRGLFDQVLAEDARGPHDLAARLAAGDHGARFVFDLVLKALVFDIQVPGAERGAWLDALEDSRGLLAQLGALRTHPTELLARHAGELLWRAERRDAAASWFSLGCSAAREAGGAGQRMARFTEALAAGARLVSGAPRGSLLNPCYECR